ncbi:MAG TPA: hypothetical protein VF704_10745 [Allosphingosinicella sp.]
MAYSNAPRDKLYGLLPATVREQDVQAGEPLRALLEIIEGTTDAIEDDLAQLYANAFIETCEPWAVPYLGDLVGWTPIDEGPADAPYTAEEPFWDLAGPLAPPPPPVRARVDVAKTISYRRRKGTLAMLEELARDVTGWPAHAVEGFELLGWTQWLRNHLRPRSLRTPDLRSVEVATRLDGPFDEIAHTVDVRPPGQHEGWHGIRAIAFHLWRLRAYPLEATMARRVGGSGDFRYHFSVLGQDAPLFSRVRREADETGLATELHVPQPIRPARLFADLRAHQALPLPRPGFTDFYGAFNIAPGVAASPAPSFAIVVGGVQVPPDDIRCADLTNWLRPAGNLVSVDPVRGRLALGFGHSARGAVEVYHHYGFPADIGGGSYSRRAWLIRRDTVEKVYVVASGAHATIGAALDAWAADGGPSAVISIEDNRSYAEALAVDLGPARGDRLAIEAADGFRPHLRLTAPLAIKGARPDFSLTLSGLLVEGRIELSDSLRRLRLVHSTVVPAETIAEPDPSTVTPPVNPVPPSLLAASADGAGAPINEELSVELAFAITGALRIPAHAEAVRALDSIIDGVGNAALTAPEGAGAPGPPLHLERTTVRGAIAARAILLASESILDGPVMVDRAGIGCVRFSYVEPGSRTPRRYRCQPDLGEQRALDASAPLTGAARDALIADVRRRVRPTYTDRRYGQPAYLQLALSCSVEITQGAEDGSEMGAYAHLRQPQRDANLRVRLEEYLPFGLDPALVYVT